MKSKRLLLKNAFRSSWKVKSQLFGISLLVMLMTVILSLVTSSSEQITHKNDYLNKISNLRDGIFDLQNSKGAKTPTDKNIRNDQTYLYQYYFDNMIKEKGYDLSWSRTEARSFSQLTENGNNINMKIVSKTSPSIDEKVSVDSIAISEGRNFSTEVDEDNISVSREMIINENFAKLNNIKIGDVVRVEKDKYGDSLLVKNSQNIDESLKSQLENSSPTDFVNNNEPMAWFHIIGFGTSADFATPVTDITTSFPDSKTSFIGYVKPENFGLSRVDNGYYAFDQTKSLLYGTEFGKESYLSFKLNSKNIDIHELNNDFNRAVLDENIVNNKILFMTSDTSYEYSNRLTLFITVITAYNVIALFLFVITILISLFALSIVLKKRVEAVKAQMGCLKALGYWKREILVNFLAIPSITAAIGVTTGYLISLVLSAVVIHTFSTFFTISFGVYTFSFAAYFSTFAVGFLLLTFFASILILIEVKKPALELLQGKNTSKYSLIGSMIKSIFIKSNFDTRLRMSIFAGSWLKFVGTFVTIFASTILITITSITPSVIAKNETASFEGMNYKFVTEYQQPIAENPLSFYKTFNPNHTQTENGKSKKYGYDESKLIKDYVSPSKTNDEVYTPLPLDETKEGIDYEILFDDLMNNNMSRYSYSPNILKVDSEGFWPIKLAPGSSRMAYLSYQILPETFLSALDKFPLEISSMAGDTLKKQWSDLVEFEHNLNSIEDNNINEFVKYLLSFYKRYVTGIPVTFNKKYINEDGIIKHKELLKDTKKITNKVKIKIELPEYIDLINIDERTMGKNDVSDNILFWDEDRKPLDDLYYMSFKELNSWDPDTALRVIAIQLATWFTMLYNDRISMYLLQTAYSRAPYFVQESIKNAVINSNSGNDKSSEFSIAFNVTPFDPKKEIKGTMLKARTNNDKSLNIYGLSAEDIRLIDLSDFKGKDLYSELFNTYENKNPIIINESLAKSLGYKVGDKIQLNITKNQLINASGDIVSADITQENETKNPVKDLPGYTDGYVTNSSRSWQSTNGKTFADAGVTSGINPVTIDNNYSISAKGVLASTGATQINKAMSNGEIVNLTTDVMTTFTVKGIQKSFGKPQAWTTNEVAEDILGYNNSKEVMFGQWFKNFDLNSKPLQKYIFGDIFETKKQEDIILLINMGGYDNLKFLANSNSDDSEYFKKYLTVFENTYPVFNYKYSMDDNINDITKVMSTTTSNGDFSAVGLNGQYDYRNESFDSGYALGSTAMAMPMDQARLVLSQLTELVQMITIMFIVFAMIISSIIILLVTSIVISENSQFIATMKLLGYRKRYIVWQIISVYLIAILIAYGIGFAIGWFSFMGVTNYLANEGAWILPVQFAFWMPIEVLGLLGIVFLVTFYAAYDKIKKLTPAQALNA
ncbi:hypothetical protein STIUS_v1c05950 [Spiroplasma sp. TIUS-1]|uniref:ABC transporter permease n=1 Tax=Spiroplasma sp. TIUS-1 TaxID=216963 RepID=UPI001397E2D4|nr:FtsX-like permease family protein [Spiroplasma sp. TIUS-1]QHX36149.1 hypothetical protein STIUS_v1c05950 [Spiroplasma sp. TIUS-1]